jgi:hypothetical protein
MSGPQDPAAAGHDRFRAGDAGREQVIEALQDVRARPAPGVVGRP